MMVSAKKKNIKTVDDSDETSIGLSIVFRFIDLNVVFVTLPTPRVDMNQSQGRLRPSLLL